MSGPTVEDLLAAVLQDERAARNLAPLLASDLVVANVYYRRIAAFAGEFLDKYGALPKDGDLTGWVEDLGDQEQGGVREALRDLRGRDLDAWTPGHLISEARERLRAEATRVALGRLHRLDDPGPDDLRALYEEIDRLLRDPAEEEAAGPFDGKLTASGARLYEAAGSRAGPDYDLRPFSARNRTTLLASPPKVGKSTFAGLYAHAKATGGEFLGQPLDAAPVLIVAPDEHWEDVRNRMLGLGTPGDRWALMNPAARPTVREIAGAARETGAGLVIIDTLLRVAGIEDENDNAGWGRWFAAADRYIRESDAVWWLNTHTRKSGGGSPGEAIRGASVIFGSVDVALTFHLMKGDPTRRLLQTEGTRFARAEPLVLDLGEDGYEVVGELQLVEALENDQLLHVRAVLAAASRPLKVSEVAERLARDFGEETEPSNLYRPLRKLTGAGLAVQSGDSGRGGEPLRYWIPMEEGGASAPGGNYQGLEPPGEERLIIGEASPNCQFIDPPLHNPQFPAAQDVSGSDAGTPDKSQENYQTGVDSDGSDNSLEGGGLDLEALREEARRRRERRRREEGDGS